MSGSQSRRAGNRDRVHRRQTGIGTGKGKGFRGNGYRKGSAVPLWSPRARCAAAFRTGAHLAAVHVLRVRDTRVGRSVGERTAHERRIHAGGAAAACRSPARGVVFILSSIRNGWGPTRGGGTRCTKGPRAPTPSS